MVLRRPVHESQRHALGWAAWASLVLATFMFCEFGTAQTALSPGWQIAAGGSKQFEVASVRLSQQGTPRLSTEPLDGLDGPQSGSFFRANATLLNYLIFAYKITDSNQSLSIYNRLPERWKAQKIAVEGRANGASSRDELRLMVQALLADRLKLAVHWETQRLPVDTLVRVSEKTIGPGLREHPGSRPCLSNVNADGTLVSESQQRESSSYCGNQEWNLNGIQHLRMIGVTMTQIAEYLAGASAYGRAPGGVVDPHTGQDGTGMTGRFDLDLEFVPEAGDAGQTGQDKGPNFSEAIRNQLGLKLIEGKGPVPILVVDHVDDPSPN